MRTIGGQDGRATFGQAFKYLGLGICNGALVLEKFDMRRGNGGDNRDVGTHNFAERPHFTGMVHAHFENAEVAVCGHARKAQRDADMIVIAFDRPVRTPA